MKKRYFLGLDLGIASIGWAISSSSEDGTKIEDFGVQVWDPPYQTKSSKSKRTTNAMKKSVFRHSVRKQNRKRSQKKHLKDLLNNKVFLNGDKIPFDKTIGEWVGELNKDQNVHDLKHDAIFKGKELSNKELSWVLLNYINKRGIEIVKDAKGNEISLEECNKKLSEFENKLKKVKSNKGKKDLKDKIEFYEQLKIALEENDPINYIIGKKQKTFKGDKNTLYNNQKYEVKNTLFKRVNYRKNCENLLRKQARKELNDEVIKEIISLIFDQLKFEDGPDRLFWKNNYEKEELEKLSIPEIRQRNRIELFHKLKDEQLRLIKNPKKDFQRIESLRKQRVALRKYLPPIEKRGMCPYYINHERAAESSIIRSLFIFCQEANSRRINDPITKEKMLLITKDSPKEKFIDLIRGFFKMKHVLKGSSKFWSFLNEIPNGEKRKRIDMFLTKKTLKLSIVDKMDKEELLSLLTRIKDLDEKVFSNFSDYTTKKYQYNKMKKHLNKDLIPNIKAYNELLYTKTFSTSNLSLKIMFEAIVAFLNGKLVGNFLFEKKGNLTFVPKEKLPTSLDNTFSITKLLNSTNDNSTVFRALMNTRKLIFDIHHHFRKKLNIPTNQPLFESINIEISGGFLLTKHERDIESKRIEKNQTIRKTIEAIISNTKGLINNANTQMLIKLFMEQGGEIKVNKDTNFWEQSKPAKCLLSPEGFDEISLQDIIDNKVENGHISSSKSSIHLIENRFLVKKEENRKQSDMLPYQYILSLKDKKRIAYYEKKITEFYGKSRKGRLLMFKSQTDKGLLNILDELSQVMTNDTRYIAKIINEWLTIELIKRDYILSNTSMTSIEYKEWWNKKIDEIRTFRINQVLGSTTSFIRKNVLFPIEDMKNIDDFYSIKNAWAFNDKAKIKELTNWDHAIDGIALSIIHNKESFAFYQVYSNALRRYFYTKNICKTILKQKNNGFKEQLDKLRSEFKQDILDYKNGIYTYLQKIGRLFSIKNNNLSWKNTIDSNFSNLIYSLNRFIQNYDDKSYKKDLVRLSINNDENFKKEIQKIESIIPIKLKAFRMNKISHHIFSSFIKSYDSNHDNNKKWFFQIKNNLEELRLITIDFFKKILIENLSKEKYYKEIKEKNKKFDLKKISFFLFLPLLLDLIHAKRQNRLNINDIECFVSYFHNLVKQIVDLVFLIKTNKKEEKSLAFYCFFPFSVYDAIQSSSLINMEEKEKIRSIVFASKLKGITLSTIMDIRVESLDNRPKKVIKRIYDGKLKNIKPITGSENPIRLSHDNRFKKKHALTLKDLPILADFFKNDKKNKNGNLVLFNNLKNKIIKFRSNKLTKKELVELHREINDTLIKYFVIMDKTGSLWKINSYVGYTINKKNNSEVKPVTIYEFRQKIKKLKEKKHWTKKEKFSTKTIEFIIFGRERFLHLTEEDKDYYQKYKDYLQYPCRCKSMEKVTNESIYIQFNGISDKALKSIPIFKSLNPSKTTIKWQMKRIAIRRVKVSFSGSLYY